VVVQLQIHKSSMPPNERADPRARARLRFRCVIPQPVRVPAARYSTTLRHCVYTKSRYAARRRADDRLELLPGGTPPPTPLEPHGNRADHHRLPRRLRQGGAAACRPRPRRPADACRAHPGQGRPRRDLAALGPGTDQGPAAADGRGGSVGAPGRRLRARPQRPPCDHLHRHGLREVARLPAPGAHRGSRGRHGLVHRAVEGPGGGPAPGHSRARSRRRPRGGGRRRHTRRRPRPGPVARQLPADQSRHAAPQRAAAAPPLGGVLPPAAVRDHRRVPPLRRRLRLAHGPDRAAATAGQRVPRPAESGPARRGPRGTGVHTLVRDGQPARPVRQGAHRPGRGGGDRGLLAPRPAHVRFLRTTADQAAR